MEKFVRIVSILWRRVSSLWTTVGVIDSEKERGVFTWADDFCNDFKLKQEAE